MSQRLKQLRDIARGLSHNLRHREAAFRTASEHEAYQNEQLKRVVQHAVAHSDFLSELYADIDVEGDLQLHHLPVVDKRLMMDNFDRWVTDPRLKLAEIEQQIETDPEEQYYLDEYRIVATSGSSGLRGIFVYDRLEWGVVISAALRWAKMFGYSPLELAYKKIASIKAEKPTHATSRLSQSLDLGIRNLLTLDATEPLENLVEKLNKFEPQLLMGYGSLISLLAEEQVEGRLNIAPEMVASFSEMFGEDRVKRARQAWGITPFNHYGAAEQIMIAADCDSHMGLHHFADMSIVEIVDSDNQPVPPGMPGDKILLTNLHKFVQPVIRYEITDLITKASCDCRCGRTFPLFSGISGRAEDFISLRDKAGEVVSISPIVVCACLIEHPDVIEYQYSLDGNSLTIRVVSRESANQTSLKEALRRSIFNALSGQGAVDFQVEVEFVERLIRSGEIMGKLKLKIAGGNTEGKGI